MLSPAALWCEGHTEWRLTGRVVNYADEMFHPVTHSHKFFPQPVISSYLQYFYTAL